MINYTNIENSLKKFKGNTPFDHCVVDDFFEESWAERLSNEFIDYQSDKWFVYSNPLEEKKALNNWNIFPPSTYEAFSMLQSNKLVSNLSNAIGEELFVDPGLHGGGWHCHGAGGNLNPHLDYSIHPKLGLQRKLNIIIYLSKELMPKEHGGHLGLWQNDISTSQPGKLMVEVEPIFNRAVIFDTTQMSWHGMSRPLTQPPGIYRKSLAIYYLCRPDINAEKHQRALFAPRDFQRNDQHVKEIIKLRAELNTSGSVYKCK